MSDDRRQAVFEALADPVRRQIIDVLATGVSRTTTEFADDLPITRQGVSKHMSRLEEAGLVRSERKGREVRYRLSPEPLDEISDWIRAVDAVWQRRLDNLKAYVEKTYGETKGDDEHD